MEIKALLANAEQVLRSESPFSEALERNIQAFVYGFNLEKKGGELNPQPIPKEEPP